MKRIVVGSENPVKVKAVLESLQEYGLENFELTEVSVDSGVNDQPQSLEETYNGSRNRAIEAYQKGAFFSIGLEDGIYLVPGTEWTYMNICVCTLFDGEKFHYGTSSSFEYPQEITDLVRGRALDVSEALGAAGYTGNAEIGSAEGAIGILSKGRMIRKDYARQAVFSALIHLDNFMEIDGCP